MSGPSPSTDSFTSGAEPPDRPTFLGQLAALLAHSNTEGAAAIGISGALPDRPSADDPATPDATFELAVKPIDHPRQLIGFWAPPEWTAFGIVATGTAHPSAPSPASSPGTASQPVTLAHIVARDGTEASELSGPGPQSHTTDHARGAVPEICRRVLGLPTAPAEVTTGALLAHQWLHHVLEARLDADLAAPELRWVDVAACCRFLDHYPITEYPGTEYPSTDFPSIRPLDWSPVAIAEFGLDIIEQWPWAIVRREATRAELPWFDIWPRDTAWMDDGMFAREVLAAQSPLHEVYSDLAELLAPSVFRHITRTLDTWGVDPFYDRLV